MEFRNSQMENMVDQKFWQGKKVLVTGHTGFKGSWLCLLLKKMGADVSGYALEPPTVPSLYELCKLDSLVKSTISDISDLSAISEKIRNEKPEIIFHMAAQALVRRSYVDPVKTYQTNVMGTVNLFEALRLSEEKHTRVLVNITTDKCYENKEWLWPYRENEPLGGYDPYSSSKACSEIVTSAYRDSFFNFQHYSEHRFAIGSARAGNVIGGGDWASDRLIPDIVRSMVRNEIIYIRNPGAIRPWQHVLEPLSGYLILAQELFNHGQNVTGAWNFGPHDNDAKTVEWIVNHFCEKWPGAKYEKDELTHPHEATYLKLDCSKAKTLLKWHQKWNLEKTIDSIIDFSKAWQLNKDLKVVCNNQIEEYLNY